ncbi:hypothetical protein LPJ71_001832, partial [Coemansia sp. S17]
TKHASKLPGYHFRAIALYDDVEIAVSLEKDLGVFNTAMHLHSCTPSNTRLNNDKTKMLCIGSPALELPCTLMLPHVTLWYLGIHFSECGLAIKYME